MSDLLDGVVLSFEVGLVKPDPAIYARALELLEIRTVDLDVPDRR